MFSAPHLAFSLAISNAMLQDPANSATRASEGSLLKDDMMKYPHLRFIPALFKALSASDDFVQGCHSCNSKALALTCFVNSSTLLRSKKSLQR